jgi:hypothetical protein
MTTLQFNCIGSSCGFISTAGAGLTWQGHAVSGVTMSVVAAAVSIAACISWCRTHVLQAKPVRVSWTPRSAGHDCPKGMS